MTKLANIFHKLKKQGSQGYIYKLIMIPLINIKKLEHLDLLVYTHIKDRKMEEETTQNNYCICQCTYIKENFPGKTLNTQIWMIKYKKQES